MAINNICFTRDHNRKYFGGLKTASNRTTYASWECSRCGDSGSSSVSEYEYKNNLRIDCVPRVEV